jgi:hypothetical protein
MALRKPLVVAGGQIEQLQSGDTLQAPIDSPNVLVQTNDESGSIVIGTPVYNDANDGVKKAKADASGTKSVLGLVYDTSIANGVTGQIQIDGVVAATTVQWDAVCGTSGGLTKGVIYYLSAATAGLLTSTAPSTAGQYVVPVGIGVSTTEMLLYNGGVNVLL